MRVLHGTKVEEAPAGWASGLTPAPVVIDLGAGDGRWAYEAARKDSRRVYVALDPDADALSEYAFRAARKPSRGGVDNAHFVVASLEALPAELAGLAALVRVNFPWGSLLRALIEPQGGALQAIAGLLAEAGRFEFVLAYLPEHDSNAFAGGPLPALDEGRLRHLSAAYAEAGLGIDTISRLSQDEALAIASSWGRRLLHARPRPVYFVAGVKISPRAEVKES
jgi:16S rRNA (adenine(1408)-N(1))-methyltransferase